MNRMDGDFRTLFLLFYKVLIFCDSQCECEDIEIIFKSAKVLEDTCKKLENIGTSDIFEDKLREFWKLKGLKFVPLEFFKKSSHHLLSKYIVDSKYSDSEVNLAIQQFLVNRSEIEFCELARELANTQQTVELLQKTLDSSERIDQFKAEQYVDVLQMILINSGGDVEEIISKVTESVSDDRSAFKIFLKVLLISSDDETILSIQEIVALSLSKLLQDFNNINLYSDLVDLSEEDFINVVGKWTSFIEVILQIIHISVEKLRCDYSGNAFTWTCTEVETCLSFENITKLISRCMRLSGMKDKIKEFLQKLEDKGFGVLADDITQKCKIK